jgi:NAD(P)-dependent dehydrogenase (short-subunit alcohol dehydrogenase family)
MKVELNGKVAVVTGAARGIGRAIADLLSDNGADVVYADVDSDGAAAAARNRRSGRPLTMDVGDRDAVDRGVESVVSDFGRLDILVNNAGINTLEHRVTVDAFPVEEWDRIVNVDLRGLFLVSRRAAQAMVKQRSGRIINVASVVGLVPLRLQCAFAAAKAGVVNLTRAMAIELAEHGVLVNAIAPGSTLTEATRELFYDKDGKMSDRVTDLLAHIPLGRPAEVKEIASAALFLAAPESSYITGHILTVDGGWTAGYMRDF